jgi:hypothetical protein
MQDFAPFIADPRRKERRASSASARQTAPATFQFSPATSKSIDIPALAFTMHKANISYKEEMFYFHRIAVKCT